MKTEQILKTASRTKNSILNIFTGFAGQLLTILLSFISRSVFIKTLGTSYLGINGLFSDILSLLSLAELGFDTAISYRLYKPIAEEDDQKVREYLHLFRLIYNIIGVVVFIIGLALLPFLPKLIKDYDTLAPLGINAAAIFILFLLQNMSTYLFLAYRSIVIKASQKQYILDSISFVINILSNITRIIVLIYTKNFTAYILTNTFFLIAQNLVNAIAAKRIYPQYFIRERSMLPREERIDLYKDCGALFVYKINNVVLKATDNIVLSSFVGLAIVGLYSNYLMIYQAFYSILQIMFGAVKASMGNLFTSDDVERKYFFFEVMNFITVILYGTAAVGFTSVSNEFISGWLGEKFVISQPLALLIGVELLFAGLKLNLAQIRNISGIFKQMWFRPVIGSVINVVSSVILVQYWGICGVIMGTILAAVFANFLVDPGVIHKHSFNDYKSVSYYYRKNLIFIMILAAVGAVDYFICSNLFTGHGYLSVIIHSMICGLSVPCTFIGLYRNKPECIYLREKFSEIMADARRKIRSRL